MPRRRFDPLVVFGVPMVGGGLILPNLQTPWYVNGNWTGQFGNGRQMDKPLATIAAAHAAAAAGDIIFVAPGEYDEDVVITKSRLTIIGCGPRHSVRVTGIATGSGGTATAMTLSGVSDVGLFNLNLEGRTGGNGLAFTGQIRRVSVVGCKLHGGTSALAILVPGSAQTVDVRVEDCVLANATNGVFVDYSGGDPCHQIKVLRSIFEKITTDCIKEDGATHDWGIHGNTFCANDGTEPTRFLDIDETGTTGMVAGNRFATTLFSTAKFAIAAGVSTVDWHTEQEGSPSTGGTSGRPDA